MDVMNGLGRKGAISESFLAERLEGRGASRSRAYSPRLVRMG
jgi:hypothetical protein